MKTITGKTTGEVRNILYEVFDWKISDADFKSKNYFEGFYSDIIIRRNTAQEVTSITIVPISDIYAKYEATKYTIKRSK